MALMRIGLLVVLVIFGLTACAAPYVELPTHEPSVPPPQPAPSHAALPVIDFTVQVGAFSTTERAARYALELQSDGLDAYYFIDTDGLYKVRFERFANKVEALRRAETLRDQGRISHFYVVQPTGAGPIVNARAALQSQIIKTALRFIGTPYRWGGASTQNGFDCSGLTMTVYRLNGLELPRNSANQYRTGTRIDRGALQNGDLVFFATRGKGRVSHVGIYIGKDRFIHAPGKGKRIRRSSLADTYFRSRFLGARRYF